MNKQEWLHIKNTKQFPMELFYEFYKIHNTRDTIMNPLEFRDNLQLYVNTLGHIPMLKIVAHYDNFFGVTSLLTKEGNLIKYY